MSDTESEKYINHRVLKMVKNYLFFQMKFWDWFWDNLYPIYVPNFLKKRKCPKNPRF